MLYFFFVFNATASTDIYTLSLHDALPIWLVDANGDGTAESVVPVLTGLSDPSGIAFRRDTLYFSTETAVERLDPDRKSTRLNSSHSSISYAVFCLKKKNKNIHLTLHVAHH